MKNHDIPIFQQPDPILHKKCKPVPPAEIGSEKIQGIVSAMKTALTESGDGVAIAAPQIGHSLRIFVVAGFIFDQIANYHGEHRTADKVFINPEIIKASKTKKPMKGEGCLSVRFVYGVTKRSETVTVKALDEHGNEFIMQGKGLLSQIFQHETDHLEGVLFTDHAHHVRAMSEQEKSDYTWELERMRRERMRDAK